MSIAGSDMKYFYVIFFIPLFSGCKPNHVSADRLVSYVADESNGLRKSVISSGTTIEVIYRPTDLLVHQELAGSSATPEQIETSREKYSQYLYFILSLSIENKEALHQSAGSQYGDLIQILSFKMNSYVSLTTAASDTIPVADFMLNRTFGMATSTDVLFVFSKEKTQGTDWVQFNLNEFGLGTGNQRLRFAMRDLEDAPQIDFAIKN